MAKERMVTRTVKVTNAIVLVVDIENGTAFEEPYTILGRYDDGELLKKAVKNYRNGVKPISVVKNEVVEVLYGMTEEMFVFYADAIEKR